MGIETFDYSDEAYLAWNAKHPRGFVVNTRRRGDPDYVVLQRASCGSVNRHRGMSDNPGGFTERNYVKVCADILRRHFQLKSGREEPFSKICSRCSPL